MAMDQAMQGPTEDARKIWESGKRRRRRKNIAFAVTIERLCHVNDIACLDIMSATTREMPERL